MSSDALPSNVEKMITTIKCLSEDGKVLDSKDLEEANPYPNFENPYQSLTSVSRNGEVLFKDSTGQYNHISGSSVSSLSPEEQEELRQRIDEQNRKIQQQIAIQQEQLQKHLADVQLRVQETLRNVGIW